MKVLMVCLGNICRSPLAEKILSKKITDRKLNSEVESVGTSIYHVGDNADIRALEVARKHNVDLSRHRGRQFVTSDFDRFDKIFTMDRSNFSNIINKVRNEADRLKVEMIMNVVEPGSNIEVPDPYFGGEDGFEIIYKMLDEACELIADEIEENQMKFK